jgi:hypothetical protein
VETARRKKHRDGLGGDGDDSPWVDAIRGAAVIHFVTAARRS